MQKKGFYQIVLKYNSVKLITFNTPLRAYFFSPFIKRSHKHISKTFSQLFKENTNIKTYLFWGKIKTEV